jgi:hypothetical protein
MEHRPGRRVPQQEWFDEQALRVVLAPPDDWKGAPSTARAMSPWRATAASSNGRLRGDLPPPLPPGLREQADHRVV